LKQHAIVLWLSEMRLPGTVSILHTHTHRHSQQGYNFPAHVVTLPKTVEVPVLLNLLDHSEDFPAVLVSTGNITILVSLLAIFILLFCLYSISLL